MEKLHSTFELEATCNIQNDLSVDLFVKKFQLSTSRNFVTMGAKHYFSPPPDKNINTQQIKDRQGKNIKNNLPVVTQN